LEVIMAVRYVQRPDGKFDGCIGDGKGRIPTPAPRTFLADLAKDGQAEGPNAVDAAWKAYKSNQSESEQALDIGIFRIDDSFPVPQANSLAKVAAAVDAIEGGANTDDAVAHAIGVTPRQGAYYANAAGYLGFVAPSAAAQPRQWDVTPAGAEFLNADAPTRAEVLSHLVSTIPEVDSSLNDGAEVEEMLVERLGESTAVRRAATLQSWMDTLTDPEVAEGYLVLESDGVRDRIDAARAVAIRAREEARRRATTERPTAVCPGCFMTLPSTGVCTDCED
jgi:hypothetical protein